jgi:hypothetical protein
MLFGAAAAAGYAGLGEHDAREESAISNRCLTPEPKRQRPGLAPKPVNPWVKAMGLSEGPEQTRRARANELR